MATNPQLETAIEKDPDDEDAYLVYADWLQTEDDPRGELIAMQAAALRDPTDKQIAQRVTELLARHDEVLLGLRALLAHPSGLAELPIAGNWDIEADARELRQVFPRLNRSLDVEWRKILHVLSEQRSVDLKFDVEKLPRLEALPEIEADPVS